MEIIIRRKLDMANRVRDFCRAHPSDNAGYTAAVQDLEVGLTRAEALAQQERSGRLTVTATSAEKAESKRVVHRYHRLLAGLANRASAEDATVLDQLRMPKVLLSAQQFSTQSRVILAHTIAHRDLLVKCGLTQEDLDELTKAVDRFDAAMQAQAAAKSAHVGARADLRATVHEVLTIVDQLGALTRHRFHDDAEALARWASARNIAWPMPKEETPLPEAGPAQPAA